MPKRSLKIYYIIKSKNASKLLSQSSSKLVSKSLFKKFFDGQGEILLINLLINTYHKQYLSPRENLGGSNAVFFMCCLYFLWFTVALCVINMIGIIMYICKKLWSTILLF